MVVNLVQWLDCRTCNHKLGTTCSISRCLLLHFDLLNDSAIHNSSTEVMKLFQDGGQLGPVVRLQDLQLQDLKSHPLFHAIDWKRIRETEAPFIPAPDDRTDTTYFDARNNMQHLQMSFFAL
ncbi:serine/threonine-protein kinase greatwall-like [Asterias rubens]|uniref:serine/threonine-protein kinase greatwall-like n=1 Tax=Asterias rubens TaxID=7604 RepID=UPI0014555FA4|nr:serine/threonine-protein kinase greatwall-like [Asterias rubens]